MDLSSSLRGAKRRSNPVFLYAKKAGLLRCARNDGAGITLRHYSFGLIAQDTLTVTDSVSSPCATGADAAMPPTAILLRNTGAEPPSSEMPSGSPSVTPAALA